MLGVGGEERSQRDGTTLYGMPEGDVSIRPLLTTCRLIGCANDPLQAGFLLVGRLVLLGEQDVESDRRGASLGQRLDQLRHCLAGPRPAADMADQFVVDVDDTHGLIEIIGPRKPALILVEDKIFQIDPEWRHQVADGQGQTIGKEDHQQIGSPLPPLVQSYPY